MLSIEDIVAYLAQGNVNIAPVQLKTQYRIGDDKRVQYPFDHRVPHYERVQYPFDNFGFTYIICYQKLHINIPNLYISMLIVP